MDSSTELQNGGETLPPFNTGSNYEEWSRIATLMSPQGTATAVVLEAPESVETANPYVFLFRSEDTPDELYKLRGPSLFYLASHIAAQWGYTETIDEIPEEVISGLLATLFLKVAGSAQD